MKKVLSNIFFTAMYQVVILIVPLVTMPYVSRIFGTELLGINSFVISIVGFLNMIILMGMSQLGTREIAKADKKSRGTVFFQLWFIQLASGLIVTSFYLLIVSIFVGNKGVYYIQIPYLIAYVLDISWYFLGIGEVKKVIVRNTIVKFGSLILVFLFVKSSSDLLLYMGINSISTFLANIFFWISLLTEFKTYGKIKKSFSFPYLKQALFLLIPLFAIQVYNTFDKTLVGLLSTKTELSFYDQSQKIVRIVLSIVTSISLVMMPLMAKVDTEDSEDSSKLQLLLKKSVEYTTLISLLLTVLLMCNSRDFVRWFFGNEFIPMTYNMIFVSLIIAPNAFGGVLANQFTLAKGLLKHYSIPFIAGAIIDVILNLILVPKWGANGGTIALIVTEFCVCIFRVYVIRKWLDIKDICSEFFKYIVIFTLILVLGFLIPNFVASLFLNMLIRSSIVFIVFLILIFLFQTNISKDFTALLDKAKKKT